MSELDTKRKIAELVERYEQVKKSGSIKKYTEAETCKEFILPLFNALGWDTNSKNEVSAEEHTSANDRADYGFYLNGWPKFYLEAKKLSADLHEPRFAEQAIAYSWNKGIAWAILTDFESLKIFNSQDIAEHLSHKLVFEIKYDQFVDRFDQLSLLSRDAFTENLLDQYGEKHGKKLQRVSVTDTLYKDLNESRTLLLKSFGIWNKGVEDHLLEEGVQKLLDRLIFIRVAEDRQLEQPTLMPMLRASGGSATKEFYKLLIAKFRELDTVYNSNLFASHPLENWEEYDGATEKVIELLHGKTGYYEYDFQAIPADVLGSVYENYLGYQLAQSDKGLEVSKNARKRKEQGIYYTPTYIVDYIVTNTLKPILDKCESVVDLKAIKVLDPACGSGSFLIRAMEMIYDKYLEFGATPGEMTKITILLENIYGVDLDEQAVEIARLNLLINALDSRMKLPDLSKNIKIGNSLICGTDVELEKIFGKNYEAKRPFDWAKEFPQVFDRKDPGFDVIIGNPPYGVSFDDEEKSYLKKFDEDVPDYEIYIYFITLGTKVLRKQGFLSYIFPNTFLVNLYGKRYRTKIAANFYVCSVVDLSESEVFSDASVRTCILVIQNTKPNLPTIFLRGLDPNIEIRKSVSYTQEEITKNIGNWLNLAYATDADQQIVSKIKRNAQTINTYFEVSQGLIPYDKYRGHNEDTIKNRIWHSDYKKNETYKKELKGADVQRYVLSWNGKTWISYGEWLAAPRAKRFFIRARVLVREITNERGLLASYSEDEYYNTPSIINVIMRSEDDDKKNLLAVLTVMNSKLVAWYHRNNSPKARKGLFPKVLVDDIRHLHLGDGFPARTEELSRLASKQLTNHKSLNAVAENSNAWLSIKSEIEKTDHQIDQLVYELYELTPEEISIVEIAEQHTR